MDKTLRKQIEILDTFSDKLEPLVIAAILTAMHYMNEFEDHAQLNKIDTLKKISGALIKDFTNFQECLENEEDQQFLQNLKSSVNEIILYIFIISIERQNDKLLLPLIEQKIENINNFLEVPIDKLSLYEKYHHWQSVYDELDDIYLNLTFDQEGLDPLMILQNLVVSFSLSIQLDTKTEKWLFRFTDSNMINDNYIHSCNSLISLLDEICHLLLPVIVKTFKTSDIYDCFSYLDPQPYHDVDLNYMQKLDASALYEYLSQFKSVRLNICDLKYLYFCLNYRIMGFDSPEIIKRLSEWLEYDGNRTSIDMQDDSD